MRFRRLLQPDACLGNGKTSLSPKLTPLLTVSLVLGCMVCSPAAARPNCAAWNSDNFFEKASVGDVAGCLKEGADPNTRDKYGLTPLHRAARNSAPPLIKALLDPGADVNARDKNGATPLHFAVGSGNTLAVAQVLLDAGADPSARDKDGDTPLHWAAYSSLAVSLSEAPEVVKVLLDAGADPSARNNLGLAPLSIAAAFSKTSVAILNSTRPPQVTPYSYTAGLSKIPGFVQTLLDAGADPNTRDKYGFTPLHRAAIFSKIPAVVQVLLDAGADPGAQTENGLTALDLIPDDSPLRGTDVERQLNDAGF